MARRGRRRRKSSTTKKKSIKKKKTNRKAKRQHAESTGANLTPVKSKPKSTTNKKKKGMSQKQVGYKYGFRSGLEEKFCDFLKEQKIPFDYEAQSFEYTIPASHHKYTPDFFLPKKDGTIMIIETKGRLTKKERDKLEYVTSQNPDIDLRIVFQYAKGKIYKGSPTTYGVWADKLGIPWFEKEIPKEWLEEIDRSDPSFEVPRNFFDDE